MKKGLFLSFYLLLSIGFPTFSPTNLVAAEARDGEERPEEIPDPTSKEEAKQQKDEALRREEKAREERDDIKDIGSADWQEKQLEVKQAQNDYTIAQYWEESFEPHADKSAITQTLSSLKQERTNLSQEISKGIVAQPTPDQIQLDPYKATITDDVFSAGQLGTDLKDSNEWKLMVLEDAVNTMGEKFPSYNLQKEGLDFLKRQIDSEGLTNTEGALGLKDDINGRISEINNFLSNPPRPLKDNIFEQKFNLVSKIPNDQLNIIEKNFASMVQDAKDSKSKLKILEDVQKALEGYDLKFKDKRFSNLLLLH